jgi:hypothetical protein
MSKLGELLEDRFNPEVSNALLDIVQRAYAANIDCYDPFIGHDAMTFGLMVHKSVRYFICNLSDECKWIQVMQRSPRFLFRIADFTISSYRAGDSIDTDVVDAFPKNRTGAWMLALGNQSQMSFDFMSDGSVVSDDANCSHLILGHIGNQIDGLGLLFVGVPSAFNEKNEITGWSTLHQIWRKEGGEDIGIVLNGGPIPPQAPIERTIPPTLTLREAVEEKGEDERS